MIDSKQNPQAVEAALRAIKSYVRSYPKHAKWMLDGHPGMTHEEHYERFGKRFKKGDLS